MRRGLLIWLVLIVAQPALAGAYRTGNGEQPVNLDLKDVDIRSAIEALFKNTGKNYSIDPNVVGTAPAISLKGVPFDTALRNLTKTAGLVYRIDSARGSDVYIVSKRPEQTPTPPTPTAQPPPIDYVDQPTNKEVVIEKIALFHTSASEMLAMLGSGGREYGGLGGYGISGYGYGSPYGTNNYYGGGYNAYPNYGGVNHGGGYNPYGGGYGNYGYGNYPRYNRSGYSNYGGYGGLGSGYGYRAW